MQKKYSVASLVLFGLFLANASQTWCDDEDDKRMVKKTQQQNTPKGYVVVGAVGKKQPDLKKNEKGDVEPPVVQFKVLQKSPSVLLQKLVDGEPIDLTSKEIEEELNEGLADRIDQILFEEQCFPREVNNVEQALKDTVTTLWREFTTFGEVCSSVTFTHVVAYCLRERKQNDKKNVIDNRALINALNALQPEQEETLDGQDQDEAQIDAALLEDSEKQNPEKHLAQVKKVQKEVFARQNIAQKIGTLKRELTRQEN